MGQTKLVKRYVFDILEDTCGCVLCCCYSDQVAVKQSQVDKLYASLKDLAGERRGKLDEVLKLYILNREIEDIEQWIAEREVVAGSHELGHDYEHVTVRGLR